MTVTATSTPATAPAWVEGLLRFVRDRPSEVDRGRFDPEGLLTFVAQAGPLMRRAARATVGAAPLDPVQLQPVFEQLSEALMAARGTAGFANPWSLAGLKHYEVRNAAVLAALWSPSIGGSTATAFLDAFIRRLPPHDALPSSGQLARPYTVRTEHCAAGMVSERVDITIEGEGFVLGIEVKIRAGPGPTQLERYARTISDWGCARSKRAAVVLLAPFRSEVDGIIPANWGDVIAAARTALPRRRRDFGYTHHLLDSFTRHAAPFRKA